DPLERRAAACERVEVELRVEDVAEAVVAAPVLQRVEVEAEDVGAGGERRVHALPLRQGARMTVEVVGQREEAWTGSRNQGCDPEGIVGREARRQVRVPLVGQMGAD